MNIHATKALFWDAIYQVLDNWVFRILVVLTGMVVFATFLIGFREDEIVLLFGVKSWSYDTIFGFFGIPGSIKNAQGFLIEILLDLIFDYLVGTIGVIFCIAATAFFVPQMIEKGAADVLFHKPLQRMTFYLARYFAGLMFVALLGFMMAIGLYSGLALVSGYHDPGILLAAPLLTYLFGLIFAVSMLIGVVTRSTVASILLTTLFFGGNMCVHWTWRQFADPGPSLANAESVEAEKGEPGDEPVETDGVFERSFKGALSTLHYLLPKTSDAEVLAGKMRKAVNPTYHLDPDTGVALYLLPTGFEQTEPVTSTMGAEVAQLLGEPTLTIERQLIGSRASYTLYKRVASEETIERRSGPVVSVESIKDAVETLREALQEELGVEINRSSLGSFGSATSGAAMSSRTLTWRTSEGSAPTRAILFKGTDQSWIHTLWIEDLEAPTGLTEDERYEQLVFPVDRSMGMERGGNSYEEQFTLSAPWRYNILFSVGSSLAFVFLVLLIGWWKLTRIEF